MLFVSLHLTPKYGSLQSSILGGQLISPVVNSLRKLVAYGFAHYQ